MALDERIAAVAGKLSRLKARHNDLGDDVAELERELADLKREKSRGTKAEPKPAQKPAKKGSGFADEDEDDEPEDDDQDDGADDDADADEDDDKGDPEPVDRRTRGGRRG